MPNVGEMQTVAQELAGHGMQDMRNMVPII